GRGGVDTPCLVHSLDEEQWRCTFELTLMRRDPDAGHRLAALLVGDEAQRRQHGLCVFDFHWVRVFLITVPGGACTTSGKIPGGVELRIAQEARLSAGNECLPRLPEFGVAFYSQGLQGAQLSAALRGDRLP